MESRLKVVESVDCGLFFRYNSYIWWKCFFPPENSKGSESSGKERKIGLQNRPLQGL